MSCYKSNSLKETLTECFLTNQTKINFKLKLIFQCVPVTWDALPQTHYTFLAMNVVMWISLLVASQKDPGFLAQNTDEYHK
jgi:hypothetical protein